MSDEDLSLSESSPVKVKRQRSKTVQPSTPSLDVDGQNTPDKSRPKAKSMVPRATAHGSPMDPLDIGRSFKLFSEKLSQSLSVHEQKMKEERDKLRRQHEVRLKWEKRQRALRRLNKPSSILGNGDSGKAKSVQKEDYLFELLFESGPNIDSEKVREVAYYGLPRRCRLRAVVWKLCLGYLPWDRREWRSKLQQQRALYRDLVRDLVQDGMSDKNWRSPGGTPWAREILKDVLRTMPESQFFRRNAQQHEALMNMLIIYAKMNPGISYVQGMNEILAPLYLVFYTDNQSRFGNESDTPIPNTPVHRTQMSFDTHSSHISLLTPSPQRGRESNSRDCTNSNNSSNSQSPNDVGNSRSTSDGSSGRECSSSSGTPMQVSSLPKEPQVVPPWAVDAEADAFFCFSAIMAEMGDVFTKNLDTATTGLLGALEHMNELIKQFDPELSRHLESHDLGSSLYGLRWITTLMSREFPIPAVCRIWDTLFADPRRFDFVTSFSIALVRSARDQLLKLSQMGCIELLNNSQFNSLPLTSNLDLDKVFDQAVEMQFQLDPSSVPHVPRRWTEQDPLELGELKLVDVLRLYYTEHSSAGKTEEDVEGLALYYSFPEHPIVELDSRLRRRYGEGLRPFMLQARDNVELERLRALDVPLACRTLLTPGISITTGSSATQTPSASPVPKMIQEPDKHPEPLKIETAIADSVSTLKKDFFHASEDWPPSREEWIKRRFLYFRRGLISLLDVSATAFTESEDADDDAQAKAWAEENAKNRANAEKLQLAEKAEEGPAGNTDEDALGFVTHAPLLSHTQPLFNKPRKAEMVRSVSDPGAQAAARASAEVHAEKTRKDIHSFFTNLFKPLEMGRKPKAAAAVRPRAPSAAN